MILLYALCICIILLLIVCIRSIAVGVKDLVYELAGIYNLLSDIRYRLQDNRDDEER